jgi:hypothetical protein
MKNSDIKLRRPIFDISFLIVTLAGVVVLAVLFVYELDFLRSATTVGIIIYLGFGLPRWIGRKTRNQGALAAKAKEIKKWGFCSRDREGPWITYIDYPLVKKTPYAKDKRFYSDWLIIHEGKVIVNPGESVVNLEKEEAVYHYSKKLTYAWDGCTPKRFFFWFLLIGTPDWWQKKEKVLKVSESLKIEPKEVFWQKAFHASLVHDALYQYLDSIPIAKMNVDRLFYEMLRESGFFWPIAKIYHLAVHFFGARDIKENDPKENSKLKVAFVP